MYLHFAVGTLSVILGCFGLLGYLVYGEGVNQIVTESFPSGLLIQIVRCLLCFAILLTYPLQIFPVIEIIEGWLFNSECNTVENSNDDNESSSEGVNDVSCQNMSQTAILGSASESSRLLAPEIPKQKSMVSISGTTFCMYMYQGIQPANSLRLPYLPVYNMHLFFLTLRIQILSILVPRVRDPFGQH